jgi:hypothetical protein
MATAITAILLPVETSLPHKVSEEIMKTCSILNFENFLGWDAISHCLSKCFQRLCSREKSSHTDLGWNFDSVI